MIRRILPWTLPLILLTLVAGYHWFRGNIEVPEGLKVSVKADVEMEGVRFFHHDKEGLRLRLRADTVRYFDEQARVELQGVNATIVGEDGDEVAITARAGEYSLGRRTIRLSGDVEVVTPRGDRLTTQELLLDQRRKFMESRSPILFRREGLMLRAKGFRYDFRQGKLVVEQQKSIIRGEEIGG